MKLNIGCGENKLEGYVNVDIEESVKPDLAIDVRKLYPGDYHVTPMLTSDLIILLTNIGFKEIKFGPEENEDYNTFLVCYKGNKARSHEDLLREEIFNK